MRKLLFTILMLVALASSSMGQSFLPRVSADTALVKYGIRFNQAYTISNSSAPLGFMWMNGDTLKFKTLSGNVASLLSTLTSSKMLSTELMDSLNAGSDIRTADNIWRFSSQLQLGAQGTNTGFFRMWFGTDTTSTFVSTLGGAVVNYFFDPSRAGGTSVRIPSDLWVAGHDGFRPYDSTSIAAGKTKVFDGTKWVLMDTTLSAIRGSGTTAYVPQFSATRTITPSIMLFSGGGDTLYLSTTNGGYAAISLVESGSGDAVMIRQIADNILGIDDNLEVAGTIDASGIISGNGSGLSNLAAGNITTGTMSIARLGGIPATGDLTKFLNERGTFTVPAGGGGSGGVPRFNGNANDYMAGDSTFKKSSVVSALADYFPVATSDSTFIPSVLKRRGNDLLMSFDQAYGGLVFHEQTGGDTVRIDLNGISSSTMGGLTVEWLKLTKRAFGFALSDETTTITTGTAKVTFRMPFAAKLIGVRASVNTVSTSGLPTVDINVTGTGTILSTKLTIDANEKTSTTAATAAVISSSTLADDAEITMDIDVAGTGAKGLKVWLIVVPQ